jgi:hypothetical protein
MAIKKRLAQDKVGSSLGLQAFEKISGEAEKTFVRIGRMVRWSFVGGLE